ncbi:hypothetical protein VNO77_33877 [Canavalia gladiata]|uniref:Uncharacterized protein n=1 Tax=Canavalia gladiata TaxID=3824 RepID=A0AAN9KFQ6_CANGL
MGLGNSELQGEPRIWYYNHSHEHCSSRNNMLVAQKVRLEGLKGPGSTVYTSVLSEWNSANPPALVK